MANDKIVYLPAQHTSRGVAGYKNLAENVKVVDKDGREVKQPKSSKK